MINQVLQTIKKYKLLAPYDRVLIAVSGGPDSMCLLWVLKDIKDIYSLELSIAHLNHCLRKEAAQEATFVKRIAQKIGIPCYIEERDVRHYAKAYKLSLEEMARYVRYAFLEEVALKSGMNKIAVGHTANDEIETLILRIVKGTGLKGLSLIPPKRGKIIRPLIETDRSDVLRFLDSQKIPYQVDKSNYDISYPRNFVRHKIIPLLSEFASDLSKKVIRLRDILEADEELLERIAKEKLQAITLESKKMGRVLDLVKFSTTELPIKRRILREVIEELSPIHKGPPSFEQIENTLNYIDKGNSMSSFNLRGVKIEKSYGKLLITRMDADAKSLPIKSEHSIKETEFLVPGEIEINGLKIKSRICTMRKKFNFDNPNKVYFDLANLKLPLFIRGRKNGDIFYGLNYAKKLKDVFIDDKIPREDRSRIPLLLDREGILWIIGKRRTRRALIGEHTTQVLEVWAEEI
ncbi:MAG: tRNA lysidine(34) synthetase TilS [bacterium]|nr:tRNA lysidine(34) synthetase TilS [bacterium]